MFKSFDKIHALGKKETKVMLKSDVLNISEKIDGSQIAFCKIKGQLFVRSKAKMIDINNPDKLFSNAVRGIVERKSKIQEGYIYYGEAIKSNKHNILRYNRVPEGNIVIWAVKDLLGKMYFDYDTLAESAGFEYAPTFYVGTMPTDDQINKFLQKESFLGGCKVEGIVITDFISDVCAKVVSDDFVEVRKKPAVKLSNESEFDLFKEQFRTEARWAKALQRLNERGDLKCNKSDIGELCKSVSLDIIEEEKENIQAWLWKKFGKDLLKHSVKGLGEWYQERVGDQNGNA